MYTFEEDKLVQEIKKRKARRVLLQLPEGLKKEALRIAELIENACGVEVIVSGEPCWGACDLALDEAKQVQADLLVLYGHAPFMTTDFPVLYLEARYQKNIDSLIQQSLSFFKAYRKIAVVTSVQHLHQLDNVKKIFAKEGKEVIIPEKKGYAFYDGQVLGCEYSGLKIIAEQVDALLVIANEFHALGAALAINKPVILLDPFNEEIKRMEPLKQKIIKQRFAAIEKAKQAKKFGIIIGLKPGQQFGSAAFVKEELQKLKKDCVLLTMKEVTPDKLVNLYDLEVFVELACPRIAIEDYAKFKKPLLTAREFAVVCGKLRWEDLLEKGFL